MDLGRLDHKKKKKKASMGSVRLSDLISEHSCENLGSVRFEFV